MRSSTAVSLEIPVMAETTSAGRQRKKAYWAKRNMQSSGEESSDAFIPGVSAPGNRRPTRVWARKTNEILPKIPMKQPHVENLTDSQGVSSFTSLESFSENSLRKLRQASLKDLCPEDKQRVANLIKELAKVGDERERAVSQLHGEREHFETQLLTLVDQQEKILTEREDVQQKLFDCQQLLTQYQAMLVEKQSRINSSVQGLREAMGAASVPATMPPIPTGTPVREIRKGCESEINENSETGDCSSPSIEQGGSSNLREGRQIGSPARSGVSELLEGQGHLASDMQAPRDLREDLRRPYTALIDKEIAAERSGGRSSLGSAGSYTPRSRSISPHDGRPRFTVPDHFAGVGPLQEPIMSSTHKSMEINAQIPDSFETRAQQRQSPVSSERGGRGRVAFNDRQETNEDPEVQLHSPQLPSKDRNTGYAEYYKKLTSSGRKQELLKQRQALLDEQERLRQVLADQEAQLKRKHAEYEERQKLQQQRMQFYREGDKFPPFQLEYGGDSESGRGVVRTKDSTPVYDENDNELPESPLVEVIQEGADTDEDMEIRNRVSTGTSPVRERVAMATSPMQSSQSNGSTDSIPRQVDVATSISFKSPTRDAGSRQGNLPLMANRQRNSPRPVPKPRVSKDQQTDMGGHRPGEKTLAVVDIVNSLENLPESLDGSYSEQTTPRHKEPVTLNKVKFRTSPVSSPRAGKVRYASPAQARSSRHHSVPVEDPEESIEEIRILEDVFFLK